jgi:hypothetical protein
MKWLGQERSYVYDFFLGRVNLDWKRKKMSASSIAATIFVIGWSVIAGYYFARRFGIPIPDTILAGLLATMDGVAGSVIYLSPLFELPNSKFFFFLGLVNFAIVLAIAGIANLMGMSLFAYISGKREYPTEEKEPK